MIRHQEVYYSDFSPRQLYALVKNVEKYPHFLPWCTSAETLETGENFFIAELAVSFAAFRETYISQVNLSDSRDELGEHDVKVDLVDGPFKVLKNYWSFSFDKSQNKTKVIFDIEFEFKSPLLQKLAGGLFDLGLQKMMSAFEERAREVYGTLD